MENTAELRIGNLIKTNYEGTLIVRGIAPDHIYACKVIGLSIGYYSLPSFEPIELTEEWLIKFGFEKLKRENRFEFIYNYTFTYNLHTFPNCLDSLY